MRIRIGTTVPYVRITLVCKVNAVATMGVAVHVIVCYLLRKVFGKNPPRGPERSDGQTLHVQAVFPTLQGEGPLAGHPAIFVRLAGCNLQCWFCDTDFESSQWRPPLVELVTRIEVHRAPRPKLVVLTGGEPLRQNVGPLLEALLDLQYTIQIETAGTLWPDSMYSLRVLDALRDERIVIVCSPKTAIVHREVQRWCRDYKYIVGTTGTAEDDGLPNESTQQPARALRLFRPRVEDAAQIWLQPRDDQDAELNQKNQQHAAALCMRYGYRLSLQQHKILGLE